MKKFLTWLATGVTCLAAAAPSFGGTILLNDVWADGSRIETNLPTESNVYASAATAVTMAPGSLSYAQSTSSRRLHTFFAPTGSPATLAVGDVLKAKVDFIPRANVALTDAAGRNFRFGFFYDPDGQTTGDNLNDSGGTGSPWTNAQGYAIFMPIQSGATVQTAPFQILKRTDMANTSLMGSSGAFTSAPVSGGAPVAWVSGNLYSLSMELCKVSATQMDIIGTIRDASGTVLSTHTVSDNGTAMGTAAIYDRFDMLAFRFSLATNTADVLDFRNFQVEIGAKVPEPATMMLAGLACIGLAVVRRR